MSAVSVARATGERFGLTERHVRRPVMAGQRLEPKDLGRLRRAPRPMTLKDLMVIGSIADAAERSAVCDLLDRGSARSAAQALAAHRSKDTPESTVQDPLEAGFHALREGEDSAGLIWAIRFTEDWYRLHMPPLKAAFEDDAISIARDAEHLSDLRAVKVVRGTPRVPPTREGEKGKRRHGDDAIALALAHFASRMRWVEYAYRAVGRRDAGAAPARLGMTPDPDDTPVRDWWQPPMGAKLGDGCEDR
jgi:hypothetical protein